MNDTEYTDELAGLAGAGAAIGRAVWSGPVPIALVERGSGLVLAVNDALTGLLGYSRDELVGRPQADLGLLPSAAERDTAEALFRDAAMQREAPVRLRHRSGDVVETLATVSPMEIGGRACAVIIVSDVTRQRRLEAAAAEERDRLAAILEAIPLGVVMFDMDGAILACNPAACAILGISLDEILGRMPRDPRWRPIRQDGTPYPVEEYPTTLTLRTGEPHETVMGIHRPDGTLVWLSGSTRMIDRRGAGGGPVLLSAFADVTVLEDARREIEVARDAAEEADRAKSRFLAVISHEMRTPLTAVMGYSQMLLAEAAGPLTPEQRHDLVQVARGADRLLSLIEDLLDLGRIQTGRLRFELEPVDLAALLKGIEPDLRVQATAEGLSFWLLAEPGLTVLADPRRLEQAVINLVSNAVKFTRDGQIRVDAVRDGNDALITVEDTGIGIPEDEQVRIFDLFHQGDASTTRRYGGLGIGLAIAKSIVERHGGVITLRSAPGEGTTFSVRLPLGG